MAICDQCIHKAGALWPRGGRYYDTQLARFQNADPTGIASGDPNLYRYVANDPVNRRDPSGNQDEENGSAVAAQLIEKAKQGLKTIGDQEFRDFLKEIPQSRIANFEREHGIIAVLGDELWHYFRRKECVDFVPPEHWNYTDDLQGSFNRYSVWSYEYTEPGRILSREAVKDGLDIKSKQRFYDTKASVLELALHSVPLGTLADRIAGGTDDSVAYTALITLGDITFVGGYLVKSAKGIKLVAASDIAINSAGAAASGYQLANDSNNKSAHAGEFALRLLALGLGIKHIRKAHADELVPPQTSGTSKDSTPKGSNVDKPSGTSNNSSGSGAPRSEVGQLLGQIAGPGQRLAGQIVTKIRRAAGFADEGIPLIIDSNSMRRGMAEQLRARGYNVRTVTEIFGADPGDPVIKSLAETLGGRVLTNNMTDFGRDIAIRIDPRATTADTWIRILQEALGQ